MMNSLGHGRLRTWLEIGSLKTRGKDSQESIPVIGSNNAGLETGQNFQSHWKFTLAQEDPSHDYQSLSHSRGHNLLESLPSKNLK